MPAIKPPPAPLEDRIRQIRAEIDEMIDARAEKEARENPGVPVLVIRNMLMARTGGCLCRWAELNK
jgi:hypothetical protein